MSQCKYAILIGNPEYPESDGRLVALPSAAQNARELESVLTDPEFATFDQVQVALDLPHWEVLLRVNKVMRQASREDQIFIFYSGHGLLDQDAQLFLATCNTDPDFLPSTAIPADNLRSLFRETQCRRIVIVLDCCFSGAVLDQFKLGPYLEASFDSSGDAIAQGYAVCVITASAAEPGAFAPSKGGGSYMTGTMIDAIRSGKADINRDGVISPQEVFEYTRAKMLAQGHDEPKLFSRGAVSTLSIAKAHRPAEWSGIVASIRGRIDRFRDSLADDEDTRANMSILGRAKEILALPETEIQRNYEALFGLLKGWSQERLSFDELLNQWYQFDKTDLVATGQAAETGGLAKHWELVRQSRLGILDRICPSYILDRNYHFLDWNPAFDELVAKQLGLVRMRHVEDFILGLHNHRQVIERGQRLFSADAYPLVDIEDLEFISSKYGHIVFKKIATQIPDGEGRVLAWSVNLNIVRADNDTAVWEDIGRRLNEEMNWSIYAKLYDRMLHQFDGYRDLVKKMVTMLGDAKDIVDLGAGTGNVLVEMLERRPDRKILAVEANEEMLQQMQAKFLTDLGDKTAQVRLFKGDIVESLREVEEDSFDGAMMMNVLYALHNRSRCLREIYRILKPGGVVVFSTSTQTTDLERLFGAIRENMERKGLQQEMRPVIDLAYERHMAMLGNILKDSEDDVVNYAVQAGFEVEPQDVLHGEYEGAVSIVKATKPTYPNDLVEEGPVDRVGTPSPLRSGVDAMPVEPLPGKPDMSRGAAAGAGPCAQLFISYAREDSAWCERIMKYLQPAVDDGSVRIWADTHIDPGQTWEPELEANLERASIALLLVTPSFLASKYIKEKELPWLLENRARKKLVTIPVLIETCLTDRYPYPFLDPDDPEQGQKTIRLSELQFVNQGKAIALLDAAQQNVFIDKLARSILDRL